MFQKIALVVLSAAVVVAAGYGYNLVKHPTTHTADVNTDGVVNLQDMSIVMSQMSTTSSTSTSTQ